MKLIRNNGTTNLFPMSAFHLLLYDVLGQWTSTVVLRMGPLDLRLVFVVVDYFRSTRFAGRICVSQRASLHHARGLRGSDFDDSQSRVGIPVTNPVPELRHIHSHSRRIPMKTGRSSSANR